MELVANSPQVWQEFCAFFTARDQPAPPRPKSAVMVEQGGILLGGACIYDTDGPFVLVENMAVHPAAPDELRAKVVSFGLQALRGHGAMVGKVVVLINTAGSIESLAPQAGFVQLPAVVWALPPGQKNPHQEEGAPGGEVASEDKGDAPEVEPETDSDRDEDTLPMRTSSVKGLRIKK